MPDIVIADTSCFIILTNIGRLDILQKLYGQVFTTAEVALEYKEQLPHWVLIKPVIDRTRQLILELQVDKGEASAIALAIEVPGITLILDDYKARKVARQLNIKITGTLGVLIKAKKEAIIPSVAPLIHQLHIAGLHLSEEIKAQAIKEAGE